MEPKPRTLSRRDFLRLAGGTLAAAGLACSALQPRPTGLGTETPSPTGIPTGTPVPTESPTLYPTGTPVPTEGPKSSDFWGPAGEAPQDIESVRNLLGLDEQTTQFLSVQNPEPGNPLVIGWVIGTNSSGEKGIEMNISKIPPGVCVDYDPNVTEISGFAFKPVDFTDLWRRVLMTSDGSARSLKFTLWWTKCDGIDLNSHIVNLAQVAPSAQQP